MRRGAELTISYSMYDYLHKYQEYVQPFMRVKPPFTDVKLLSDPKSAYFTIHFICILILFLADPLKVILMSSIFSIGATIFGNVSHAQEFRHKARQLLMVMFDVTHPMIAAINHLLSKSYLAAGEFEKVRAQCVVPRHCVDQVNAVLPSLVAILQRSGAEHVRGHPAAHEHD